MRLNLVLQNLKVSDKYKTRVTTRFIQALDKHLHHLPEELKIATLTISKNLRLGYHAKFDLQLPFGHVFAENQGKNLFGLLMHLRDTVKKQVRNDVERLREFRR